jgi:hypothetical protein
VILALALALAAAGPRDLSTEDSRELMRDFSRCMAKRHGKDATAIVNWEPASQLPEGFYRLFKSDCLPRGGISGLQMRGKLTQYRYALAEALLLRAYGDAMPAGLANAGPLTHPAIPVGAPIPAKWRGDAAEWQEQVALSQAYAYVSAFGECVARAAPDQAWALLKTEVVSREEQVALAALAPAMSGCISKGQQVELNKFNVRGSIALNFYRLAMTTGDSGAREAAK